MAAVALGWPPDTFWHATPAELGAVIEAMAPAEGETPPDRSIVERLMKEHPDD